MSFPVDCKVAAPSAPSRSVADEERTTFGQQSPYVPSGSALAAPGSTEPSSSSNPAHSLNPQDYPGTMNPTDQEPPPTYDEVTRGPGAPQLPYSPRNDGNNGHYGDQPESSGHHSPSAPLLSPGPQGSNGYSSISRPPARSYSSSVSSHASSSSTDRARRFNKFWVIFFAVVLILFISDSDQQDGVCQEDSLMRRNLASYTCSNALVDFTITVSEVKGFITVEQDTEADFTELFAEVYASDRDRLRSLKTTMGQKEESGEFVSATFATANYQDPGCVFANIRIVFGGKLKQIRRLKIASMEGNVTINMLGEGQAEILELDSRVITGHSSIRVKAPLKAKIGGSVGSIRGDLVLGKEFAVNLVEGSVAVNLANAPSSKVMQGKVVVAQGNVTVGLAPHYNGIYTVRTGDGDAKLQNIDPERTVVTKDTGTKITGWNSADRREPKSPTSELKVETTEGDAILSFRPIDLD